MPDSTEIKASVIESLARRQRRAAFVTQVEAQLKRAKSVEVADVEQALADLAADWSVVVRDHYCADPHVEGTDLRVVALIDRTRGDVGQLEAMSAVEATWQEWLTEYMANHRCT